MYAEIEEMERILATFLATKSAGASDHKALIQQQIACSKQLCPSELEYQQKILRIKAEAAEKKQKTEVLDLPIRRKTNAVKFSTQASIVSEVSSAGADIEEGESALPEGQHITDLTSGNYFGQLGFAAKTYYKVCNVYAKTDVDLIVIEKAHYQNLLVFN